MVEQGLDYITDPVERVKAADAARADLAVILTRSVRRSCWQAKMEGIIPSLVEAQWRGRDYILVLARQHEHANGLPTTHVKDIVTRRLLDLTDLARLRGRTR